MSQRNSRPPILFNQLFHEIRGLDLDPDHFVIFGSAPLAIHGLRTRISDLDVVARGDVWRRVSIIGTPIKGEYSGDLGWQLGNGHIEFFDRWITDDWDTDALIDGADIFGGIRFASLTEVLRYKEQLKRPDDLADIAAIEARLAAGAGVFHDARNRGE